MDKPQRHLMKMRHFRRRLKNLGLKACDGVFFLSRKAHGVGIEPTR